MVAIKAVPHFSIPVSDVARSTRFCTEIVGCRHLSTVPGGHMAFLDVAGTCLILVNPRPADQARVRHGVEITFEENRLGGVLTRSRAYFHDPDGTVLEFIDLTRYAGRRT